MNLIYEIDLPYVNFTVVAAHGLEDNLNHAVLFVIKYKLREKQRHRYMQPSN